MTIVKIGIGSAQILGQLDFALHLTWPKNFQWLVDFLQILLSFDLLKVLKLGCVMVAAS